MTNVVTPQHKNPCTVGHEILIFVTLFFGHKCPGKGGVRHDIYNFGRPFDAQYYCKLILSDLCQIVEKKINKY